jgi:putative ABC transport system permease protein
MIYHYIQSFLRTVKKNRFFYAINLIGFLTGFLVLAIISTFVFQEISFDNFHKNADNIYRIHSGGYGVTPLCIGDKLKDQLPEISGIIRFSSGNLNIVQQGRNTGIDHIFHTDKDVFKVFSFKLLSGDENTVLKNPFSMVISQSTSRKIFGKHFPVGESIRDVRGDTYQITGVMEDIPYNSHIQADAFISIETLHHIGDEDVFDCGNWSNLTYISLFEESDSRVTENKLNMILHDSRMNNTPLKLQQLNRVYFDYDHNKFDGCRHGNLQTLLIYASISIFILFIVILNYLNLFAAISGARLKEIAIRKIHGAMSSQIVKQIVSESLLAVFISFGTALLIIEFMLPELSKLLRISIPGASHNWRLYAWYFFGVVLIWLTIGFVS